MAAALAVYAEVGWAGFTFDAIASRAGVGKAGIYRRWPTKLSILRAAWEQASRDYVEVPNLGDVRSSLLAYATEAIHRLTLPVGAVEIRIQLDARMFPDEFVFDSVERRRERRRVGRAFVDTAVARGELPAGTRPELIFDAVRGTILHRFLVTPPDLFPLWEDRASEIAEEVVDMVLAGVRA